MNDASEATLIVTLRTTEGFLAAKKRILKIRGVRTVEMNFLTQKLRVRYCGDEEGGAKVLAEIENTIAPYVVRAGVKDGDQPGPQHATG
jgi:hypothetical protein